MGKRNGAYEAEFPVHSTVRIASRAELEAFMAEWKWHLPLQAEQLRFADRTAQVVHVGFYHGADELYTLDGVPGLWHEACLRGGAA